MATKALTWTEAREARKRTAAYQEAGEAVNRAREERRKKNGDRSADEIKRLRKLASETATVCADCFRPLAPDASVTLTVRFVEHFPGGFGPLHYLKPRDRFLSVPVCLHCWLIDIADDFSYSHMRGIRQDDPVDRAGPIAARWQHTNELRRLRCEWCGRPMRVESRRYPRLALRFRCCSNCLHKATLRRNNIRRRVHHEPRACVVCGEMFIPTQSTQKTCGNNTCRQQLFRQRHAG